MTEWCAKTEVPDKETIGPNSTVSLSSLLMKGWQPLLITGFLRDTLIRHFNSPGQIEADDLRNYLWSPDEKTGILIESVYRWRGDVVQKRPAILVKRNAYQSQEILLNNLVGTIGRDTATKQYQTMWIGSHTLFCVHGTGASVEILATEVQRFLTGFSPAIREYLALHKCAVTEVGPISEVEEAKENYVVPITVAWGYQENWTLRMESLPLRRLPLSVLIDWQEFQ